MGRTLIPYPWVWEQADLHGLWEPDPHELGDAVVETLELISHSSKELLEMRFWERLTFREIAERIGKNSRGVAKYYVNKAEDEFKEAFMRYTGRG